MITFHYPQFILALTVLLAVAAADACDTGTVRDAAFHGRRHIYRLGMIFSDNDIPARERFEALEQWFIEHGDDLNIRLERLTPDQAMPLRHFYGLKKPPESYPITLLSAMHPGLNQPVILQEWTPAPPVELLEGLRVNPLLNVIARETADYWALVLYARGRGASRREEVDRTVAHWRDTLAPGVKLLDVDRHDADNAWLCRIANITDDGEDWAGVVFAKGKLMMPVLVGNAITQAELDRLLHRLTIPCTCLQQAMTFGLDLPMFWDEREEADFTVLASPIGYMEMTIEDKVALLLDEVPEESRATRTVAVFGLGGGALLVLGFLAVAWMRR